MSYLLDTCVLSEFTRRQPQERVVRWLSQADEETLLSRAGHPQYSGFSPLRRGTFQSLGNFMTPLPQLCFP
jgi:hypothetical protein